MCRGRLFFHAPGLKANQAARGAADALTIPAALTIRTQPGIVVPEPIACVFRADNIVGMVKSSVKLKHCSIAEAAEKAEYTTARIRQLLSEG